MRDTGQRAVRAAASHRGTTLLSILYNLPEDMLACQALLLATCLASAAAVDPQLPAAEAELQVNLVAVVHG